VAAGFSHTVAVKSDGTLWAWGSNGAGQVGDGTTAERYSPVRIGTASHWATVACGNNYSVAMGSDGTLWAWGNNFNGQLAVC
jgi:alpha-tubulin suppressor-like RCC1 family protein